GRYLLPADPGLSRRHRGPADREPDLRRRALASGTLAAPAVPGAGGFGKRHRALAREPGRAGNPTRTGRRLISITVAFAGDTGPRGQPRARGRAMASPSTHRLG